MYDHIAVFMVVHRMTAFLSMRQNSTVKRSRGEEDITGSIYRLEDASRSIGDTTELEQASLESTSFVAVNWRIYGDRDDFNLPLLQPRLIGASESLVMRDDLKFS